MIGWPGRAYQEGRCWDHAFKAPLKPRAPCHNCSYLSVGGEWIPSMNNRLSLIFLGELRLQILQLISGFFILLIYVCILCARREDYSIPLRLLLCPVKNCKMLSGSWKLVKCQRGITARRFSQGSADASAKHKKKSGINDSRRHRLFKIFQTEEYFTVNNNKLTWNRCLLQSLGQKN